MSGALAARLRRLSPRRRAAVLAVLPETELRALDEDWASWAHDGQLAPPGDWRVWVMMAGRGFGKTRAGAEWVNGLARAGGHLRIALVAASAEEARRVMVEGASGLLAVAPESARPDWEPSRKRLSFPGGAEAFLYSGAHPEGLRGPEHHFAWCDELAKWQHAEAAWDMLQLGLRLGTQPRALVTTTPRAGTVLRRILAAPGTVLTGGPTQANPHLPPAFVAAVEALYGGTRMGRQELGGELIEDVDGALWTRALIERCRDLAAGERPLVRIVVGVDPPASKRGDACGIVVCGLGDGGLAYVLADHSAGGLGPEGWARKVVAAVAAHDADRVVAEGNQGGDMIESVLKAAGLKLPVKLMHARRGKGARAEPVAALFEAGRAKFAGRFPELEDELAGFVAGGYAKPGSPDRADAMIWAMDALMLRSGAVPGLRRL